MNNYLLFILLIIIVIFSLSNNKEKFDSSINTFPLYLPTKNSTYSLHVDASKNMLNFGTYSPEMVFGNYQLENIPHDIKISNVTQLQFYGNDGNLYVICAEVENPNLIKDFVNITSANSGIIVNTPVTYICKDITKNTNKEKNIIYENAIYYNNIFKYIYFKDKHKGITYYLYTTSEPTIYWSSVPPNIFYQFRTTK